MALRGCQQMQIPEQHSEERKSLRPAELLWSQEHPVQADTLVGNSRPTKFKLQPRSCLIVPEPDILRGNIGLGFGASRICDEAHYSNTETRSCPEELSTPGHRQQATSSEAYSEDEAELCCSSSPDDLSEKCSSSGLDSPADIVSFYQDTLYAGALFETDYEPEETVVVELSSLFSSKFTLDGSISLSNDFHDKSSASQPVLDLDYLSNISQNSSKCFEWTFSQRLNHFDKFENDLPPRNSTFIDSDLINAQGRPICDPVSSKYGGIVTRAPGSLGPPAQDIKHTRTRHGASSNPETSPWKDASANCPDKGDYADSGDEGNEDEPISAMRNDSWPSQCFACPFHQKNRKDHGEYANVEPTFRDCSRRGWKKFTRVAHHLWGVHRERVRCPRCCQQFHSIEERHQHLDERPMCEISSHRVLEVNSRKLEAIGLLVRQKLTDAVRWDKTYEILFPGDPIPSRYYGDDLTQETSETGKPNHEIKIHYEDYGHRRLSSLDFGDIEIDSVPGLTSGSTLAPSTSAVPASHYPASPQAGSVREDFLADSNDYEDYAYSFGLRKDDHSRDMAKPDSRNSNIGPFSPEFCNFMAFEHDNAVEVHMKSKEYGYPKSLQFDNHSNDKDGKFESIIAGVGLGFDDKEISQSQSDVNITCNVDILEDQNGFAGIGSYVDQISECPTPIPLTDDMVGIGDEENGEISDFSKHGDNSRISKACHEPRVGSARENVARTEPMEKNSPTSCFESSGDSDTESCSSTSSVDEDDFKASDDLTYAHNFSVEHHLQYRPNDNTQDLSYWARILIGLYITSFHPILHLGLGSEVRSAANDSGQQSSHNRNESASQENSNVTKGKPKRQRDENEENEDQRDGGKENGDKRPKRGPMSRAGSTIRPIPCPFYLHDPETFCRATGYKTCPGGYTTFHRLNEHIKRCHRVPLHCLRCKREFDSGEELHHHLEQQLVCEVNLTKTFSGVTADQKREYTSAMRELKKVDARWQAKWQAMFRVIFPGQDVPDPNQNSMAKESLNTQKLVDFCAMIERTEIEPLISETLDAGTRPASHQDIVNLNHFARLFVTRFHNFFQRYHMLLSHHSVKGPDIQAIRTGSSHHTDGAGLMRSPTLDSNSPTTDPTNSQSPGTPFSGSWVSQLNRIGEQVIGPPTEWPVDTSQTSLSRAPTFSIALSQPDWSYQSYERMYCDKSRGVADDRMTTAGLGEAEPVGYFDRLPVAEVSQYFYGNECQYQNPPLWSEDVNATAPDINHSRKWGT